MTVMQYATACKNLVFCCFLLLWRTAGQTDGGGAPPVTSFSGLAYESGAPSHSSAPALSHLLHPSTPKAPLADGQAVRPLGEEPAGAPQP